MKEGDGEIKSNQLLINNSALQHEQAIMKCSKLFSGRFWNELKRRKCKIFPQRKN